MGKTHRKLDSRLRSSRPDKARMKQALGWLEMRKSRIHGRGVFARRDIPAGTRLIEYVGLPVSKKKSGELCLKQNSYVFTLNESSDLNGKVSWNPARLINHSCEPNCEANLDENDRIWIFSIKPIPLGQELTFNYGYSLEDFRIFPAAAERRHVWDIWSLKNSFPSYASCWHDPLNRRSDLVRCGGPREEET
jgi:SET domain-containing protein